MKTDEKNMAAALGQMVKVAEHLRQAIEIAEGQADQMPWHLADATRGVVTHLKLLTDTQLHEDADCQGLHTVSDTVTQLKLHVEEETGIQIDSIKATNARPLVIVGNPGYSTAYTG